MRAVTKAVQTVTASGGPYAQLEPMQLLLASLSVGVSLRVKIAAHLVVLALVIDMVVDAALAGYIQSL